MEFWGVEVKPGKPFKVEAEENILVHISQASLGDCKGKKEEFVPLFVKVDDQKLVLGTLSTENIPQLSCDLVFEKDFELSHNWGKGSVYFTGYRTPNIADDHRFVFATEGFEDFSDSEEEEEEVEVEVPATIAANGNATKAVAKPKAKPADDEEDDSDSEDGMDEDDSDDEDDSEEEEETPTPKKPVSSKKRANEASPKTPVSAKKAKAVVTPQKTEEKKKAGPATPHPAKKGGKAPATATQTPKSASQVSCGSCKKTFNSGNALEAHNNAKHSAAK